MSQWFHNPHRLFYIRLVTQTKDIFWSVVKLTATQHDHRAVHHLIREFALKRNNLCYYSKEFQTNTIPWFLK